jgi:nucleotide-binding universal stress UspA family protein
MSFNSISRIWWYQVCEGFYQSAGFAFGSVSQRLLAYAPCSLMLVPGKVTPGLGLRVLLATDGSPDALRAAGLVRDLTGVREIVVVCVVRPLGAAQAVLDRFQSDESRTMRADLLRSRRAAARKAIAETVERLAGGTGEHPYGGAGRSSGRGHRSRSPAG